MTARTHDLAALTAIIYFIATQPIPQMNLATAIGAFGANMIGGMLPDIDDASSDFWDTIRIGNIVSKITKPLLGNHRMITHSLLGMAIIGFILKQILAATGKYVLMDMDVIWLSAMIGFFSHLVMDSITKEGVPWLFPVPIKFGFPPIKFLRIKTGGAIEKAIIFPGLMLFNIYLIYNQYPIFYNFFKSLGK